MSGPHEREPLVLAADYESLRRTCDELQCDIADLADERDSIRRERDVWRKAYLQLAAESGV